MLLPADISEYKGEYFDAAVIAETVTRVAANGTHVMFSAEVKVRTEGEKFWKESVSVVSASHSGAGFYVRRECRVGELVSLLMPMPKPLRRYDQDKKYYRIWGLIQHCSPLGSDPEAGFHVGVAFIGKVPPASFHANSLITYRVCGISSDGLWEIDEAATPFMARKQPRYWKPIEASLAVLNGENSVIVEERSVTENISENGASITSTLNVNIGDKLRFSSPAYQFTAFALVRNRQPAENGRSRLHLEFVDNSFPILQIEPVFSL